MDSAEIISRRNPQHECQTALDRFATVAQPNRSCEEDRGNYQSDPQAWAEKKVAWRVLHPRFHWHSARHWDGFRTARQLREEHVRQMGTTERNFFDDTERERRQKCP